jgi:hypothetical protein
LASDRPSSPVPALALPVLTSSAAIGLPLVLAAARWALAICTGAAQKRFSVNTPATVAVGASFITSVLAVRLLDAGFGKADFNAGNRLQFGGNGQGELTAIFVISWVEKWEPLL